MLGVDFGFGARGAHFNHVPPAFCPAGQQGLSVGQASVVDAHVYTLVQGLDGREHGEDLLLIGQVALVRDQGARVSGALALGCKLLEHSRGKNS